MYNLNMEIIQNNLINVELSLKDFLPKKPKLVIESASNFTETPIRNFSYNICIKNLSSKTKIISAFCDLKYEKSDFQFDIEAIKESKPNCISHNEKAIDIKEEQLLKFYIPNNSSIDKYNAILDIYGGRSWGTEIYLVGWIQYSNFEKQVFKIKYDFDKKQFFIVKNIE